MSARSITRAHARELARRDRRGRRATVGAAVALGTGALFAGSAQAANFQVNTTADGPADACDATCTLRDAVEQANLDAAVDTITFASGVTGEITLTAGEIPIDAGIDIQGPGRNALTVSGDANGDNVPNAGDSRVFNADVTTVGAESDPVAVSGLTLAEGFAGSNGGIIQSEAADLTISDSTLRGGFAASQGGGLYSEGRLTINSSAFTGNTADNGGGLYADQDQSSTANGDITITNSTFSNNVAADYNGGGAYFDQYSDNITITGSTFNGNSSDDDGAGLNVYGPRDGSFTMRNSTVSGNTAGAEGGGLKFGNYFDSPAARIENSTIAGNSAVNTGGGIYRYADEDDADPATDDTVVLSSTIVADNTAAAGADLGQRVPEGMEGPIVGTFQLAHSLIEAPLTGVAISESPAGSNVLGADPALGTLADNGGPTETRLPGPASPALDAGIANGLQTDQRGFARTTDLPVANGASSDGTDIGAVELRVVAAKIKGGPKGTTKETKPKFRFSGEGAVSFECRIDKGAFAPCTSPFKPGKKLADGKHKFQVRAISADGVAGPTSTRKFTVDTKIAGARLAGKGSQAQGTKVKVRVKASAKEAVTVVAKGKIVAGGKSFPLKKATKNLKAGKVKGLALKPKSAKATDQILAAVDAGKKVVAKVKAKFADKAGNKATKKKNFRLK